MMKFMKMSCRCDKALDFGSATQRMIGPRNLMCSIAVYKFSINSGTCTYHYSISMLYPYMFDDWEHVRENFLYIDIQIELSLSSTWSRESRKKPDTDRESEGVNDTCVNIHGNLNEIKKTTFDSRKYIGPYSVWIVVFFSLSLEMV